MVVDHPGPVLQTVKRVLLDLGEFDPVRPLVNDMDALGVVKV